MDIATKTVTVRRDTRTATVSIDGLRALALTAVKNAVDPDGSATFGAQDATVNANGSITVTLSTETVQAEPAPASAPAPLIPLGLAIPDAPILTV